MKPRQILLRLARRFGLLVVLIVLGAVAGGIYGAVKTPTYVAQAYVVVTGEPGDPFAAVNFAQAYGRIATKGPLLGAAATALGSRAGLDRVSAATSPDAPVVELTASGTDAERTAEVANAVAKALVDHANGRRAETRVSASVLAAATVPDRPSSPKPPLELAIGAAAGLLLGGLTVLAGVGRRRPSGPEGIRPAPSAGRVDGTGIVDAAHRGSTIAIHAHPAGVPPRAIDWHPGPPAETGTPDAEPDRDSVAAPTEQPDHKVVGRAVVIYQELP